MVQKIKEVPYGVSDFQTMVEQNIYYVDKTMYIPELEKQARYLIFIRPRRFGKSIFQGMLHAYYDCRTKHKFQQWFGDLWIGKHPTPLQGRYQVMHLDFSQVGGNIDNLEEKFNFYMGVQLDGFVRDYAEFYSDELRQKVNATQDAGGKLALIQNEAKVKEYPLYLIIDEYDNFTNTVLNEQGEKVYWAMTHAEGFYRDIFKKFKGSFERIFITGVSPVTLDDVTSGFNIGWHISTKPEFNQMLGFSTEDVYDLFNYYKSTGEIRQDCDVEAVVKEMKPWYDNYCFSEDAFLTQSKVFNCDMVIYYLRNYMSRGEAPKEMIDPNTKTDYNKMKKLLQLDKMDGKVSSIRDGIEAERNLQGFFMAYLSLNPYYYTAPELELNHGYCDFFLLPDLTHYPTKHSYIIELKLVPKRDKGEDEKHYEARIEKQWQDAKTQIYRYAEAPRVEALRQGTQLHKIVMQFDGWKLKRMDEV